MADTDEYFPRGGKKPNTTYFKQSGNFLGAAEKGEKRKKPKKKCEDDDGYLSDGNVKDVNRSYKNCASRLSYKTIKQGVGVLGRVRTVQETKLTVALPGNMTGTVMACHISETYNKMLEAYVNDETDKITELSEMFHPGQYVVVKVLEVEGTKLMLSLMPQHVNSGRVHTDLQKGDLFQAAVASVEDHGYVMDIGIPNTRPFLPKNKTNPDIGLEPGMLTWCCVRSLTAAAETCVLALSSELAALQRAAPRRKPSQLLPATPVFFTVDKPLDNGIEGHVFDDTTAYIQRHHAGKVKGRKPALGQKIKARVLYVMPTRLTPFLTMRDMFESARPLLTEEQTLSDGQFVDDAQVVRILGRSVQFRLRAGAAAAAGVMSLRHVAVHEDLDDEQVVAKSYPIGSTHRVRVVSYNPCDGVYVVSDRAEVLAQRYFSLSEVSSGQLLDAQVRVVAESHLLVDVGRISGYIPQTHFTDAGVFVDPKKASVSRITKKFKPGQALKARALVVDRAKNNLLLTLKPSLLAEDLELLTSYEDAQIGKSYTGFIRLVRDDYVLVSFFDNVTAYVQRQYVTKEPLDSLVAAFHNGQIVNCTILRVDPDNKKMSGSLTTAQFWPASKRENLGKRKHKSDDPPDKKQKQSVEDDEPKEKKKKKKKAEEHEEEVNIEETMKSKKCKKQKNLNNAEDEVVDNQESSKKKKKKSKAEIDESDTIEPDVDEKAEQITKKNEKRKKQIVESEEVNKVSEESDAIETDIHEDSDHVLTPQDLFLIDLSDCDDVHKCKKRIVSLMKNINARTRRIDKIEKKILRVESTGLNAKNKKFHTAMHTEKLVSQERIKKLLEGLKQVQEKLKEFGYEGDVDEKKKKEKKVNKKAVTERTTEDVQDGVKVDKRKETDTKESKERSIDIKVVDSLEPALEVPSAKDFWSVNTESLATAAQEESSSSDEEEPEQPKKKRKKSTVAEKLAKVRAEEEHLRALEQRAAAAAAQPRSCDQFERALLANPDSSQLWIAYMAFHLQATEIEKARAAGRRALKTISFREEHEKLNVWLALLHCEHRFGTKESQQQILEEALQMNEPFKVHSKLLDILVETSKPQELSSLVEVMLRKYRREASMYQLCGAACYKLGLLDKARHVMQKAMAALDNKEHVSLLVAFALLERACGQRERAAALLEQLLAVYPRRSDAAAVHLHQLLQDGATDQARQVLERLTSLKLPARTMKIYYKKWIEIEEKIGDQDKLAEVRQKAMEYIEKAKF